MVGFITHKQVGEYMKIIIFILIANISVFSLACSNEQAVVVEKSSQDKLSEDNVFKGYETVLDKAKGVEQTILDAADARKKEMEEKG
ncbi:MAG: hypothetical protein KJO47_04485 [Gammaproteobacteria bacterium]|nr:hypothetical protein [Gammaproteobacteria bacterium]